MTKALNAVMKIKKTEMELAVRELNIGYYGSCYNPRYTTQALASLFLQPKLTRKTKERMRGMVGRTRLSTWGCCVFYRPWGFCFPLDLLLGFTCRCVYFATPRMLRRLVIGERHEAGGLG